MCLDAGDQPISNLLAAAAQDPVVRSCLYELYAQHFLVVLEDMAVQQRPMGDHHDILKLLQLQLQRCEEVLRMLDKDNPIEEAPLGGAPATAGKRRSTAAAAAAAAAAKQHPLHGDVTAKEVEQFLCRGYEPTFCTLTTQLMSLYTISGGQPSLQYANLLSHDADSNMTGLEYIQGTAGEMVTTSMVCSVLQALHMSSHDVIGHLTRCRPSHRVTTIPQCFPCSCKTSKGRLLLQITSPSSAQGPGGRVGMGAHVPVDLTIL